MSLSGDIKASLWLLSLDFVRLQLLGLFNVSVKLREHKTQFNRTWIRILAALKVWKAKFLLGGLETVILQELTIHHLPKLL